MVRHIKPAQMLIAALISIVLMALPNSPKGLQTHDTLPHEAYIAPTSHIVAVNVEDFIAPTPRPRITFTATPMPTIIPTPQPAYLGCDLWHSPQNCPDLIDEDFTQRRDLFPWGGHQTEEMIIELGIEDGSYRWDIFSRTSRLFYHWITPHERDLFDKRIVIKGRLVDHTPMLSWGLVFQHTSSNETEDPTTLYFLSLKRLNDHHQMYGLFEIEGEKVAPVWGWRKLPHTGAWDTIAIYQKYRTVTVYINGIEIALLGDITTEDGFGIAVFADGLRQQGMLEIDTLTVTLPVENSP